MIPRLKWSLIRELLSVKKPDKRARLAELAEKHGWSLSQLKAAIQKNAGKPVGFRYGPQKAMDAIQGKTRSWLATFKKVRSKALASDHGTANQATMALLQELIQSAGQFRQELERAPSHLRRR